CWNVTQAGSLGSGGRDPNFLAVWVLVKLSIIEIEAEDTELPHLIGDVFAGVGHSSVRPDEDLVVLVLIGTGMLFERHHPAAFVIAFALVVDHSELFHLLESLVPKMQMQYL